MKDGKQGPDTSAHEASQRLREAVKKDLEPYSARLVEGVREGK